MCSNNFGTWSTLTSVWNAGKRILKGLRSGGLFSVGPTGTSKPSRYRTKDTYKKSTGHKNPGGITASFWMFAFLALGFYITPSVYPNSLAMAAQMPMASSGLLKTPFDVNKVIEKAEHLPVLKDGQYVVEDPAYKAIFGPQGITYFPILSGNRLASPFSLSVSQIGTSSGQVFWSDDQNTIPARKENTLIYQRTPDIQEVYEIGNKGVEQSWIFQKYAGFSPSSDLQIVMEVRTSLSGKTTSQMGIEFVDHEGIPQVKYSKAVIIDAEGKAIEVAPGWDASGSRIVLNIPGRWLAAAVYPVIVDPLLNTADIAVDTQSTTDESYPAVAFDGTNYLVVYQSGTPNGTGSGSTDIKGVLVSAVTGSIVGGPLTIGATAGMDDEHPSVAYDPSNTRYLVVWEKWNSATASDILLRTVTTAGGLGTTTTVSASATRIQAYSSIACCDATNAYVVWVGPPTDGDTRLTQLRGALVDKGTLAITYSDPTGTITNSAGPTSSPTTAPSISPKIIFASTTPNRYFMIWEDFSDTNGDLSANIYTVGTGWGTQWTIAATGGLLERYPVPAFDGTNFLVAYQRGATGGDADIYGQFATTAGANLANPTSPFAITAQAGVDEVTPGLAWVAGTCSATPVNRYLVAWIQGTTVQTRPITTAGALESTLTISVNTTSTKANPAVASYEGGCGYLVTWSDNRSGTATPYDIYAQRVGYPNINNLSPNSGDVGASISINGFNFGTDPGAGNRSTATNNIKINGTLVPDSNITLWSDSTINFTIPTDPTYPAPGTYPLTTMAGSWTGNSNNLTLTNSVQITNSTLPAGYQWLPYSGATLVATGGTPPYSNWIVVLGALPQGLTLNPSTGQISGTPTGAEALETVSFTVQVSDSVSNTATKGLSITIYKLSSITITDTSGTPVSPTINQGNTFQFKAKGTYSDLSQYDISNISPLEWKTSNSSVATIGLTTGLASGVGAGTVTICAVTAGEACP